MTWLIPTSSSTVTIGSPWRLKCRWSRVGHAGSSRGETYALHVASGGTGAELQITNPSNHEEDPETIIGTAGDDLIEFIPSATPGQWTVRVNGSEQHFQTNSLVVAIDGLEG